LIEGRPQTQVGSVMQIAWVLSVVNARKIKGAPSNTGRLCDANCVGSVCGDRL